MTVLSSNTRLRNGRPNQTFVTERSSMSEPTSTDCFRTAESAPRPTRFGVAFALLLLALALRSLPARGAVGSVADERGAVLAAVQAFFDAMAAKDAAAAAKLTIGDGVFHSVREIDGKEVLRTSAIQAFVDSLPAQKGQLRERLWEPEVRVHGSIAMVWTPYDFWIDGKRSHCGIDLFTLVKTAGGWRIGGGAYTVEKECEPSPLGPL